MGLNGYSFMDDEDDEDLDGMGSDVPYDSISDITQTPDFNALKQEEKGMSGNEGDVSSLVKSYLSNKMGQGGGGMPQTGEMPSSYPMEGMNSPMNAPMGQPMGPPSGQLSGMGKPPLPPQGQMPPPVMSPQAQMQQEGPPREDDDLSGLQMAMLRGNALSNIAQGLSPISRGVSPPVENPVYKSMADQQNQLFMLAQHQADRKNRIANAIANRQSREKMHSENMAMRDAISKKTGMGKESNQSNQNSRLLNAITDKLNTDPIIKPSEMNRESLKKSLAILENKSIPLSSEALSDAEQDLANAMSIKSQGATEGKIRRTEIDDLNRRIAKVKQKYGSKISDLRVQAPEIVEQVLKMNHGLLEDYNQSIKMRVNKRLDEYSAAHQDNEGVMKGINRLKDYYNPPEAMKPERKQSSPHAGKQIFHNGKTYRVGPDGDELIEEKL